MKSMNLLLVISLLFFIAVIAMVQCTEPEEKAEKEINYLIKAKTANRLYIKDVIPEAKIPIFSNEIEKIIPFEEMKILYTAAKENCVYVSLDGGTMSIDNEEYYYESIIEIERGNKNATYGVSGIEIIYFKLFDN